MTSSPNESVPSNEKNLSRDFKRGMACAKKVMSAKEKGEKLEVIYFVFLLGKCCTICSQNNMFCYVN